MSRTVYYKTEDPVVSPLTVFAVPPKEVPKNSSIDIREFQRLYGHLFSKNHGTKPLSGKKACQERPRINLKTIQLEMPIMGAESKAEPNKPVVKKIAKTPIPKSPKPQKPHELFRKLSSLQHTLSKDSKINIHHTTSTVLDRTHKELDVADEQLKHIKEMIDMKRQQVDAQTSASPRPKLRSCHSYCNNQRSSSLSTMRRKLKELNKDVQNLSPSYYKSVKERCTLECLYKKFDDAVNFDEAATQLGLHDKIKSPKIPQKVRFEVDQCKAYNWVNSGIKINNPPSSPKKNANQMALGNLKEDESKQTSTISNEIGIQASDNEDDEAEFLAKIEELQARISKNSSPNKTEHYYENAGNGDYRNDNNNDINYDEDYDDDNDNVGNEEHIFDDTNLQSGILKSSFLMKEFNVQTDSRQQQCPSANKKEFIRNIHVCKDVGSKTVRNMLGNLEFALENSIYSVEE